MIFTARQRKILQLLWNVRDYITVKDIADEVSYSEKTVRSDLKVISREVELENTAKLIGKTNKGFYLDIDRPAYEKIAANFIENKIDQRIRIKGVRILIILLTQQHASLQELADGVWLDKSALKKYLTETERWLAKFNITLQRSAAGITLRASEDRLRNAWWQLFSERKQWVKVTSRTLSSQSEAGNRQLDDIDYHALKVLFKHHLANFALLASCIDKLESHYAMKYSYNGYLWLTFNLMLIVSRHQQSGSATPMAPADIPPCPEQEMAHYLFQQLTALSGLTLCNSELRYITACMLTSELNEVTNKHLREEMFRSPLNISRVTKKFIASVSDVVGSELIRDRNLQQRLIMLIRPVIYRVKFNLNPPLSESSLLLVKQVKLSYLDLFLEVEYCSALFTRHYQCWFSEQDLALITLCIKSAQSQSLKKVRVVIVCNYGIGISQFVAQKITRAITQVEIVDILSLRELHRLDSSLCDLVITTVPLHRSKEMTLEVNDVLLPYDLALIKETVKKMQKNSLLHTVLSDSRCAENHYKHYFSQQMTFVIADAADKYQLLRFICDRAVSRHAIDTDYLSSVIARDNAAPTEIASGVVLIHGDPTRVKQNFISFTRLTTPLSWDEHTHCDVVIMVAFHKGENQKIDSSIAGFYSKLAQLVEDDAGMKNLRQCATPQALFHYLNAVL